MVLQGTTGSIGSEKVRQSRAYNARERGGFVHESMRQEDQFQCSVRDMPQDPSNMCKKELNKMAWHVVRVSDVVLFFDVCVPHLRGQPHEPVSETNETCRHNEG